MDWELHLELDLAMDVGLELAEVEKRLAGLDAPITVAVMGCEVNGPGEAREADVGVAAGKTSGILFRKGKVVRKVPEDRIVDAVEEEARVVAEELKQEDET